MTLTVGIHLIWTSYGTWLPGDDRGHWSPLFDLYGHLVASGSRLNVPDVATYRRAQELLKEPPKWMSVDEMDLVAKTISAQLAPGLPRYVVVDAATVEKSALSPGKPGAKLPVAHACAIESNHVHLLLGPVSEDISKCAGRLKGTSSSALLKHPNHVGRERIWTTGFWKVFLFDIEGVVAVQEYIQAHNIRRGLPASPYEWLQPI